MSGAWESSDRRARLPSNWAVLRKRVLKRDGSRCVVLNEHGQRCVANATDVDHIIAGDNHSMSNLQALCRPHHKVKTAHEASIARAEARKRLRFPDEKHPGFN